MLKAYKYRIYPNNEQKIQIAKTFGCCRFVYNQTLAYRKEVYEKEKKSVSKTDCNNYCNRQLKKEYEWLKEVDKFVPFGMTGKKNVSDYLTDRKFSLFEKENQYVVCSDEKIIWLVGERSDNRFRITNTTKRVMIIRLQKER
mgnify:CR=1 FL=1